MVLLRRIELRILTYQASVIPFNYKSIKQDAASKPGLEPTTHPQAGRPAEILVAEKSLL